MSWLAVAVLAVALCAEIPLEKLPPEARETIALVKAGGPFPYQRDGSVFYNREDQWDIPVLDEAGEGRPMEQYYTIMRLPHEQDAEFIHFLRRR